MSDVTTMLAFLLLGQDCTPDATALHHQITTDIADAVALSELSESPTPLVYRRGDYVLSAIPVDQPLPAEPGDLSLDESWLWKGARQALAQHNAHVSLGVTGGENARDRALILQQLIAAAAKACPQSLGILYTAAETLWPAELFTRNPEATKDSIIGPVFTSVHLTAGTSKDAFSATTKGLAAFGLMEIETAGYVGPPDLLNEMVYNFAGYLIDAGPVIKDGDTVGPDATTKFTVHHVKASNASGSRVYRLEFTGPQKRRWFFGLFGD